MNMFDLQLLSKLEVNFALVERSAMVSSAHLIEMKSSAGRSKDLIDIEELRKIQIQQ